MNILVCISRVPDTASRIIVASGGKTIDNTGIKFVVNPYDEIAIEEGLRLREKNGGTVTCVVLGTEVSKDILRTALAMGVDKAVIIKTADDNYDSYFTAENLANYAKTLNPDIILLGKQSVDYDSLQMPSTLGELLNMPSVSVVTKLTIEGTNVTAEREVEGGKEVISSTLPCIISAQKGLNDPRYPKLPDIMKAKSKPIEEVAAIEVAARVEIVGLEMPSKKRIGKLVTDSEVDIAEIVKLLHEEAKVI